MGTIVTIILLVVVLVLGIFFVQKIFGTGNKAIDQIDTQVQNEINKLFTQEGKSLVVYPNSREISIKQGETGGFGFSIKNTDRASHYYDYRVEVSSIPSSCSLTEDEANGLIALGGAGRVPSGGGKLGSGQVLDNAVLVKFDIPKEVPLCLLRYDLTIYRDGLEDNAQSISIDLQIR